MSRPRGLVSWAGLLFVVAALGVVFTVAGAAIVALATAAS